MNYRLVLIGEAPGRESIRERPSLALTGSSGRNLAALAGWDWLAYLKGTERVNLFLDPQPIWNVKAAAASAASLEYLFRGRSVIILGEKVAAAFGLSDLPNYEWVDFADGRVARVPHPSGRNRKWNTAAERKRARSFLEGLLT